MLDRLATLPMVWSGNTQLLKDQELERVLVREGIPTAYRIMFSGGASFGAFKVGARERVDEKSFSHA